MWQNEGLLLFYEIVAAQEKNNSNNFLYKTLESCVVEVFKLENWCCPPFLKYTFLN